MGHSHDQECADGDSRPQPDSYYAQLTAVDIADVVRELVGDRITSESSTALLVDCPRHASASRRSLCVSLPKQSWFCFGCGMGGDVLHFVEFVRSGSVTKGRGSGQASSHQDARDWLANRLGMPRWHTSDASPEDVRTAAAEREEREHLLDCQTRLARLYHGRLLADSDALAWVQQQYGFDPEVLREHLIGFADNRGVIRALAEAGFSDDDLVATGAFRSTADGSIEPFLQKRVTFPFVVRGAVHDLAGRRTPWTPNSDFERSKYRRLPRHDTHKHPRVSSLLDRPGLWGEDTMASRPSQVLVVEGIPDAIAVSAAGFPTVSPVTTRFRHDDLQRLVSALPSGCLVAIVPDQDWSGVGQDAALRTAQQLMALGVVPRIVALPPGDRQQGALAELTERLGDETVSRLREAPVRDRARLTELAVGAEDHGEEIERLIDAVKIDPAEWFRTGGDAEAFAGLIAAAPTALALSIHELQDDGTGHVPGLDELLDLLAVLPPLQQEGAVKAIAKHIRHTIGAVRGEMKRASERQRAREATGGPGPPAFAPWDNYRDTPEGIVYIKRTTQSVERILLTNFQARIVAQVELVDGLEAHRHLELEATLDGKTRNVRIPTSRFRAMTWPIEELGPRALVASGVSLQQHVPTAIQALSGTPPTQRIHTHLGWTQIPDHGWQYLHAGGAIGPDGPTGPEPTIGVQPPDALSRYLLPPAPVGIDRLPSLRAALDLLDRAPDHLSVPLLAAVVRSVLGPATFSVYVAGGTGIYKSSFVAVFQSFFGAGFDESTLPGSWSSTDNALEQQAFLAKDAVFVIDDFAPRGSAQEQLRLHAKADRILRAQGNQSARGRLTADSQLQRDRPPRGLIVATGEDLPTGHSLRSRTLVLEMRAGDIQTEDLTLIQKKAADGLLAGGLTAFLEWLAPRLEATRAAHHQRRDTLRATLQDTMPHGRTATAVADMQAALEVFTEFLTAEGALDEVGAAALLSRTREALVEVGKQQGEHQAGADVCALFVELLGSALSSGVAHLASLRDQGPPGNAPTWGWRPLPGVQPSQALRAEGICVGWVDDKHVYLDTQASYKAAQSMGSDTERLAVTPRTLIKRLAEAGWLARQDPGRGKHTVRVEAGGRRRNVLVLDQRVFGSRARRAHCGPMHPEAEPDGPTLAAPVGPSAEPLGPKRGSGTERAAPSLALPAGPAGPKGPKSKYDVPP